MKGIVWNEKSPWPDQGAKGELGKSKFSLGEKKRSKKDWIGRDEKKKVAGKTKENLRKYLWGG